MPVLERFLSKVPNRPDGECWQWGAGKFNSGYGAFAMPREGRRHQNRPAHLVAYELFIGSVPEGLHLDHLCHTRDETCRGDSDCPHRGCVNPWHLEPVTPGENNRRGHSPSMTAFREGTCLSGRHDMSDAYERDDGRRQCRPCQLENGAESRRKSREERAANPEWQAVREKYLKEHPAPRVLDFYCNACRTLPGDPCRLGRSRPGEVHTTRVKRLQSAMRRRESAAVRAADLAWETFA